MLPTTQMVYQANTQILDTQIIRKVHILTNSSERGGFEAQDIPDARISFSTKTTGGE
jgi:hypothetical protein